MSRPWPVLNRNRRHFASVIAAICAVFPMIWPGLAQTRQTSVVATIVGPAQVVFDPARHACDGHDVPDAPLRAFRDENGLIHVFGLHYENRQLTGKSLLALTIQCPVVFRANGAGDPARYDDRSWLTATWSRDGRTVSALVHHEFQAHRHPGRCSRPDYMSCWWNAILAASSGSRGDAFRLLPAPVVAATPFRSETGQGRHRGFFNPSNIFSAQGQLYTFIGTTGWVPGEGGSDQPGGVCLFRAADLEKGQWRAFDGKGFSAAFPDPYSKGMSSKGARCQTIAPFPAPVGSVVRHRATGLYIAAFQAKAGMPDGNGGRYAVSGFYTASSRDLLRWSSPQLLLETKSLYDDACNAGVLRSYPVLIDDAAEGRNFEDIGDTALLFFSEMRISGCDYTSDRKLVARKVRISPYFAE